MPKIEQSEVVNKLYDKKTLFVSDLDGTLLQSNGELSEFTITKLNELISKGLNFTISTARTYSTAFEKIKKLNLKLPIVLMNGVAVYNIKSNKYERISYLEMKTVLEILKLAKNLKLSGFLFEIKDDVLSTFYEDSESENEKEHILKRRENHKLTLQKIDNFESLDLSHVAYYSFCETRELLQPLYNALQKIKEVRCEFYQDTYDTRYCFMEIFSANASKKKSINYFREILDFALVVGFGDNLNDLPLFEGTNYSVAVENAKIELKNKANAVAEKNDEDGVLKFLLNLEKQLDISEI